MEGRRIYIYFSCIVHTDCDASGLRIYLSLSSHGCRKSRLREGKGNSRLMMMYISLFVVLDITFPIKCPLNFGNDATGLRSIELTHLSELKNIVLNTLIPTTYTLNNTSTNMLLINLNPNCLFKSSNFSQYIFIFPLYLFI